MFHMRASEKQRMTPRKAYNYQPLSICFSWYNKQKETWFRFVLPCFAVCSFKSWQEQIKSMIPVKIEVISKITSQTFHLLRGANNLILKNTEYWEIHKVRPKYLFMIKTKKSLEKSLHQHLQILIGNIYDRPTKGWCLGIRLYQFCRSRDRKIASIFFEIGLIKSVNIPFFCWFSFELWLGHFKTQHILW